MFSRLTSRQAARRIPNATQWRRPLSTSSSASGASTALRRTAATTAILVSGTLFAVYYFDSRSAIHRYFLTPLLRHALDPEISHKVAVKVLRSGLAPRDMGVDDERLRTELWGESLSNPIGLAAGFDKNGEAIDGLFNLGFAWVEIGSVTPKPQPGNPKPRVFQLPDDDAMINRYGFPSDGAVAVLSRLRARLPRLFEIQPESQTTEQQHASLRPHALLAINLGKNKTSPPDSPNDFLEGVKHFSSLADVLVVNVSSPNTPGLRGMQTRGLLEELLGAITSECDGQSHSQVARRPRVVLKIAPDLDEAALEDIAEAVKANPGVDGVIVSNTTTQRPASLSPDPRTMEMGGLSGAPLKPLTLRALRTLRSYLPSSVTLIGCGGISSGADALEYAQAGANAVQVYTAFGYAGVGACRRIKDELAEILAKEGTTWDAVVRHAVKELSEKSKVAKKQEVKTGEKEDSSLQMLIDEALAIRRQLEALGKKMGEKGQDMVVVESSSPSA